MKLVETTTGVVHVAKATRVLGNDCLIPKCVKVGGALGTKLVNVRAFDGDASLVTCRRCLARLEKLNRSVLKGASL